MVQRFLVCVLCLSLVGCTAKKIGYTVVGAGAGGAVGYALNKEKTEAGIGAGAGAAAGALLATVQENTENRKFKKGYEQGYNQAQVDVAVKNWEDNTGKCARCNRTDSDYKHLMKFRVPERKQDDVLYESHYVTLEDYR